VLKEREDQQPTADIGEYKSGALCNDTSSERSPRLQHFVAQRLTEQEDVSFYLIKFGFIFYLLVQRDVLSSLFEL